VFISLSDEKACQAHLLLPWLANEAAQRRKWTEGEETQYDALLGVLRAVCAGGHPNGLDLLVKQTEQRHPVTTVPAVTIGPSTLRPAVTVALDKSAVGQAKRFKADDERLHQQRQKVEAGHARASAAAKRRVARDIAAGRESLPQPAGRWPGNLTE